MTDSTNALPDRPSRFQTSRQELRFTLPTVELCGLDLTFDEWLAVSLIAYGHTPTTWEDDGPVVKSTWIKCPTVVPSKVAESVRYATRGWFPKTAFRVSVRRVESSVVVNTDMDGNRVLAPTGEVTELWIQPGQRHISATLEDILPLGADVPRIVQSLDLSAPTSKPQQWRQSPMTSWVMATRCVPGIWVKYREPVKRHIPWHIHHGSGYSAVAGEFAVATRDDKTGDPRTCDMYVMYLGKMQPPTHSKVSERIDDLLFVDPPWVMDAGMRRVKYADNNCQPPLASWLQDCVRQNPGMALVYPMPFDMHANVKARIEEGRGYGARPGEFDIELTEITDFYGGKLKKLRAKVSAAWRQMYPDYPDGVPEPDEEPAVDNSIDALAMAEKKVRHVTLDDALQPGERTTADGTPAW